MPDFVREPLAAFEWATLTNWTVRDSSDSHINVWCSQGVYYNPHTAKKTEEETTKKNTKIQYCGCKAKFYCARNCVRETLPEDQEEATGRGKNKDRKGEFFVTFIFLIVYFYCLVIKDIITITSISEASHNHVISEAAFKNSRKQRRITKEEKAAIMKFGNVTTDARAIADELTKLTGKQLKPQQIRNVFRVNILFYVILHWYNLIVCRVKVLHWRKTSVIWNPH